MVSEPLILKQTLILKPQKQLIEAPQKPKTTLNEIKIKVSIEESIENTSGLALRVDPKTVFGPYSNTKNIQLVAKKAKNNPNISSKMKIRIEGSIKSKSCQLYEMTTKQCLNHTPTTKTGHFGQKTKNYPTIGYNN